MRKRKIKNNKVRGGCMFISLIFNYKLKAKCLSNGAVLFLKKNTKNWCFVKKNENNGNEKIVNTFRK